MTPTRRGLTATLVAAMVLASLATLAVAPVGAQDLTRAEWEARLADTARGGPPPQAESVEGRPVDVSLLGSGPDRQARASAALGGTVTEPLDPDALRAQASRILSQPAYTGEPQRGWQRWLFDNPVTRWVRDMWNRFIRWVFDRLDFGGPSRDPATGDPGRPSYGWPLLIAVGLGAGLLAAGIGRRRRARERAHVGWFHGIDDVERTPESLEQEAERSEQAGELAHAIRYRFLAGLLRLDANEFIDFRPSITMRELRATIGQAPFEVAADIFERAAYAPDPPTQDDVARHRQAWDELLGVRR